VSAPLADGLFIRHKNPDVMPKPFDPLTYGHPLIGTLCPACRYTFLVGERVLLIPLGPGESIEEGEKAANGRYYNAVAVAVHSSCALGVG
jgi:hypothetical protein